MQAVNFSFRPGVLPEAQKNTLREIENWSEVNTAASLRPGAKAPAVQRMAYARVEDASVNGVVEKLNRLAEIEQVDLPAERCLIAPSRGATAADHSEGEFSLGMFATEQSAETATE